VLVGNVAEIKAQAEKFGKPTTVQFLDPVPDEERAATAPAAQPKAQKKAPPQKAKKAG